MWCQNMFAHVCTFAALFQKQKQEKKVVAGCLTDEEKEGKGSSIDKSKIKKMEKSVFSVAGAW